MPRLTIDNIDAAISIRNAITSWDAADEGLEALRRRFRSNSERSDVLVKASAIDKLYSTRAGNIYWVADAVIGAIADAESRRAHGEVVTEIDLVNLVSTHKRKRHPGSSRCASFASKYCHFFVKGQFPIFDSFALLAVNDVLGCRQYGLTPKRSEYRDFCERIERLRVRDGLQQVSVRDMDRYLWLWGQWLYQKKSGQSAAVINADVHRALFKSADATTKGHVLALQPRQV